MVIYRRNPRVVARALADDAGALLLHRDTDAYHRLNRTGARLWEALERPATLSWLVRELAGQLDTDPNVLREDLEPYLASLVERELLLAEDSVASDEPGPTSA